MKEELKRAVQEENKVEISQGSKYLPVRYTDVEKLEMGAEMARLQSKLDELEAEKKSAMDSIKERISAAEADRRRLSNSIVAGYHHENVKCEIVKSFTTGRCVVVRKDTGEIVEDRTLSDAELQMSLKIEPESADNDEHDSEGESTGGEGENTPGEGA